MMDFVTHFPQTQRSRMCDTRNPGSVDYLSTRGLQVDVGLPDATSENQAESPLYVELYLNETPA